jgi:aspartyl-tRNA(Asn)/glutamyl-tRNA(Gln) amidotransferase subunit A
MANELCWMTVTELAHGMRAGAFSPVEVTQAHLERIAALNPQLEAYLTITAEHALTAAARAEAELRSGCDRGPLHGVPYSLKDVFATQGVRTTAGSAILADWVPDEDAAAKVCMRPVRSCSARSTRMSSRLAQRRKTSMPARRIPGTERAFQAARPGAPARRLRLA